MNLANVSVGAPASTTVGNVLELRSAPGGAVPQTLLAPFSFNYGSSGTSCGAFLQSSVDGGATYFDVACASLSTSSGKILFSISPTGNATVTPSSGSLAANTAINAYGSLFRLLQVSAGTYANTTLKVDLYASGLLTQQISGQ